MKTYRCKFECLDQSRRAHIVLEEDKGRDMMTGDNLVTSRVRTIDFDRGLIVTQNSIYLFRNISRD